MTGAAAPAGESRYFDEAIETMPRPELRNLQQDRMLELIELVYESSALHRQRWEEAKLEPADVRTLDDFSAAVPFTDKALLRSFRESSGDPYSGLLCVPERELLRVGFGSGTTGEPIYFPERFPERPLISDLTARDLWEMGLRPDEYMVWMGTTYRSPWYLCAHAVGAVPVMCDHLPDRLPQMLELSRQLRPSVLMALSGPLVAGLERLAATHDLADAFSSFKAVIFAGEPLSERKRDLIRSWGASDIFDMSAGGDMVSVFDCREHAGFHAWEDAVLVEVIDPVTLEPVPDGEPGEMVVTALTNHVAPFVRYRSDDLIEWTSERCACGRTHGRFRVLGRVSDQVVVEGRSILPTDVMRLLETLPATEAGLFQIIRPQRDLTSLRLRVGYDPARAPNAAGVAAAASELLVDELGVPVDVELVCQDELLRLGPPHKVPRVASA